MDDVHPESQPNEGRLCCAFECEEKATHRCSGCKKAWYCSAQCQKRDWNHHILDCKPKTPIRTAHYLLRACRDDLLPTDPQTLKDYGFERASYISDEPGPNGIFMLFGVYGGLYSQQQLEPRILDKHMKEGSLLQFITECFEKPSQYTKGAYYPWLLQHAWVLTDSPPPPKNTVEAEIARMKTELWRFLGPIREAQYPTWPKERKICADFYSMILSGVHPGPECISEFYIDFGFCVARDLYYEMQISRLYRELIHHSTFEEFCDAFKASSLVALMEQHIAVNGGSLPPHFKHIMRSRVTHESVWDLKHFVYRQGGMKLIPCVHCDYGFMNCKSPDDVDALTAVYKTALDNRNFDEMELHAHCIQGKTFEYVSKFQLIKMKKKRKEKFARLMKNPYPLPPTDATNGPQAFQGLTVTTPMTILIK